MDLRRRATRRTGQGPEPKAGVGWLSLSSLFPRGDSRNSSRLLTMQHHSGSAVTTAARRDPSTPHCMSFFIAGLAGHGGDHARRDPAIAPGDRLAEIGRGQEHVGSAGNLSRQPIRGPTDRLINRSTREAREATAKIVHALSNIFLDCTPTSQTFIKGPVVHLRGESLASMCKSIAGFLRRLVAGVRARMTHCYFQSYVE